MIANACKDSLLRFSVAWGDKRDDTIVKTFYRFLVKTISIWGQFRVNPKSTLTRIPFGYKTLREWKVNFWILQNLSIRRFTKSFRREIYKFKLDAMFSTKQHKLQSQHFATCSIYYHNTRAWCNKFGVIEFELCFFLRCSLECLIERAFHSNAMQRSCRKT